MKQLIAVIVTLAACGLSAAHVAFADPPATATEGDPMPLVEKQWQAFGGRDLQRSIRTRIIVSTTTINGVTAIITEMTKAPDKILIITEVPSARFSVYTGYNGKVAWTQDSMTPRSRMLGPEETKGMRCAAISQNASALFSEQFHETYRLKPDQVVSGKRYFVLNSKVDDCPDADSYLDAQTYLPRFVAYSDGVHTGVYVLREYFPGPLGEPFPRFTTNLRPFGPITTITVSSVKDNVEVEDARFSPPPFIVLRPPTQ